MLRTILLSCAFLIVHADSWGEEYSPPGDTESYFIHMSYQPRLPSDFSIYAAHASYEMRFFDSQVNGVPDAYRRDLSDFFSKFKDRKSLFSVIVLVTYDTPVVSPTDKAAAKRDSTRFWGVRRRQVNLSALPYAESRGHVTITDTLSIEECNENVDLPSWHAEESGCVAYLPERDLSSPSVRRAFLDTLFTTHWQEYRSFGERVKSVK